MEASQLLTDKVKKYVEAKPIPIVLSRFGDECDHRTGTTSEELN